MFGVNYPKKYISERKGEYPFTLADYSKAETMLGYKPIQNLKIYLTTKLSENMIEKTASLYNYV